MHAYFSVNVCIGCGQIAHSEERPFSIACLQGVCQSLDSNISGINSKAPITLKEVHQKYVCLFSLGLPNAERAGELLLAVLLRL